MHCSGSRFTEGAVCCFRCGARLHRLGRYDLGPPLALALTAAILFVIANVYPMVVLEMQGTRITTTLVHAVRELWREDVQLVAALVFVTVIVVPATQILAMLYVLLPLRFGRVPRVRRVSAAICSRSRDRGAWSRCSSSASSCRS